MALVHTADSHVATFKQIFNDLAPGSDLDHRVDVDLLDTARRLGIGAVRSDVHALLTSLTDADAVLCTCSTLGPLADEIAASAKNILRIDRPLMEQACTDGRQILVAICLESTRGATLDLLNDCARDMGRNIKPRVLVCDTAWGHFEQGDMPGYAAEIACAVSSDISYHPDVDCVVLAQASMRVAEEHLSNIGRPVLSSPTLAAQRSIDIARQTRRLRQGI